MRYGACWVARALRPPQKLRLTGGTGLSAFAVTAGREIRRLCAETRGLGIAVKVEGAHPCRLRGGTADETSCAHMRPGWLARAALFLASVEFPALLRNQHTVRSSQESRKPTIQFTAGLG
jgi:hypothetical protein